MITRHCPFKPTKAAQVLTLFGEGKTRVEIATAAGCSTGYVAEVLREAGHGSSRKRPFHTVRSVAPVEVEDDEAADLGRYSQTRADKLLRRFSWEVD